MIKKITTMLVGVLYILPHSLFAAADYIALSPELPMSTTGNNWLKMGMPQFLDLLFMISIAVAAVLAVLMIAIGGFKYMTSESVFKIGGAKEQIVNAIVGLLIVLAAIAVLKTINPDLIQLDIFTIAPNIISVC